MNGWAAGFARYLGTYEVRLHRRKDTFGGVLWPVSGLVSPERQLELAIAAGRGRVA